MSYDLVVELSRQNMPTPSVWRAAIIEAGFPVELHPDFDVETFSGFLPAPVRGETSGFYYHSWHGAAKERQETRLDATVNFTVMLAIGTRPLELISALAAASVLASISGGTLVDPQEGSSYTAGKAIEWALSQIE